MAKRGTAEIKACNMYEDKSLSSSNVDLAFTLARVQRIRCLYKLASLVQEWLNLELRLRHGDQTLLAIWTMFVVDFALVLSTCHGLCLKCGEMPKPGAMPMARNPLEGRIASHDHAGTTPASTACLFGGIGIFMAMATHEREMVNAFQACFTRSRRFVVFGCNISMAQVWVLRYGDFAGKSIAYLMHSQPPCNYSGFDESQRNRHKHAGMQWVEQVFNGTKRLTETCSRKAASPNKEWDKQTKKFCRLCTNSSLAQYGTINHVTTCSSDLRSKECWNLCRMKLKRLKHLKNTTPRHKKNYNT